MCSKSIQDFRNNSPGLFYEFSFMHYTSWVVIKKKITWIVSFTEQLQEAKEVAGYVFVKHHFLPCNCAKGKSIFKKKSNVTASVGMEREGNERRNIGGKYNDLMCEFGVLLQLRISCPAACFTAALQELIFISIWIQYLSSGPWPCLILLLCSASQMHSDPEHWRATQRHPHTHNKG